MEVICACILVATFTIWKFENDVMWSQKQLHKTKSISVNLKRLKQI